jgi:RNA polymerase sigma-70 factor (ECF subfamily)
MELFSFDDEYVRRLRLHDRETEAHFEAYFRELLLIKLRRRLATAEAIEDVRQEVLLRVVAKLDELRDGRKLGAFVNAICNHVLMEHYRDDARAARTDYVEPEHRPYDDIERDLVDEERRARVRRVLTRLPERDADILRALFMDELTKDEVCRRFGVDRGYLRVLLHRAKEKFRAEFRRKSTPDFVVTLGGQSSLSL